MTKSYCLVFAFFFLRFEVAKAQLIKPCKVFQDKFTGVVSKTFYTSINGDMLIVGGGVFGADTLLTIALTGQVALSNAEKFTSEPGDSCIVIQRSGQRTRLIAKSKAEINKVPAVMGVTYHIDANTLKDFINDPPTDIGIFGKPYHIPIPIPKYQQKQIPKAIECFFQL
jgi:hypothetical protein